jgi:hypothetical protein
MSEEIKTISDAPLVPSGEYRDVILTPQQMADYLSIPVRQLEDLRRAKKIAAIDLGKKTKRYHLPSVLKRFQDV